MSPENEDVTPEVTPEVAPEPVQAAVTPEYVGRDEFKQRMDQLEALFASRVTPQPVYQAPVSTSAEPSDEELFEAARQGSKDAFKVWTQRQAGQIVTEQLGRVQRSNIVNSQLAALYAKYPELSNPQHQLAQRTAAFRNVLMQMGEKDSPETTLNAMLRAVADSRDLFTSKPVSGVRTPPSGQIPAQHRQPSTSSGGFQVSPEEVALARKMGVKDAAKAKEKFWQRNAEGKSSVSPTISAALNMEQGNA